MDKTKLNSVTMWTWAIKTHNGERWELCRWAEPTKKRLLESEVKPSPEAQPVRVLVTPCPWKGRPR